MSLAPEIIASLAEHVEAAEREARDITKLTDAHPEMDFKDAYDIQWAARALKEARGTQIVGMKMGLTSRAKMKQMGVEQPCYGYLADYFEIPEGGEIKTSELVHPKVEAEIAFVTKEELSGPCHVGQVLAATDFICPAVEIIDSRYENFRFDLPSVIADNSSSSRFVTGSCVASPSDFDLRTLGVVLEVNGQIKELGAGAAVLGHPANSVALLVNMLAERGESLPAGSLVLSGGITAAVTVNAGDSVNVRFQHLGSVGMRFV
jgi:2-oxo-3-hexenedioate decarboxylase